MEMLLANFQRYIQDNELLVPGERVLLTVSGGVDSMVMLSLFARSGYDIGVAHCNFQLRGPEAEEDEVLVEREAAKYGVPYYNTRFDTAAEMERTGESVQMAARRLRYEWFDRLSREHGYRTVAIAHHADDSIETFFINLFRGTGLRGLTGIHQVNGKIVRPLLFASRRDILEYAMAHKIAFREDSSNRSTKYLRNKIRLGLVPRMREISPKFTQVMSANVKRLTDAQLFITRSIEMIRREAESRENDFIVIDPAKIHPGLPADFVIYELMSTGYGFRGDAIDALNKSLATGVSGKRFYARDYMAYIDRGRIVITPVAPDDACETAVERDAVRTFCGNSVLYYTNLDIDNVESLHVPEHIALIDADKLHYPLHVRRWNDGDHFIPLGMEGHKKVSDFLIDEKVPLAEKQRQFVLLDGDRIVWLIGRRIDERYKVGPETENILKIVKEVQ